MLIVFGKHGQVAFELQRLAARDALSLRAFSSQEANFTHPKTILSIIENAPHDTIIINAAAYTAVDQAESDVEAARQLNATTPGLIAQACAKRNFPLIHLSTDYVFPGQHDKPYLETDPTGPATVYGRTKLEGEHAILSSGCKTLILRTSWVFSSTGKNFVKTMLRVGKDKDSITVVSDQTGGPTAAASIAETCLTLAQRTKDLADDSPLWGIYHYSGHPQTTWNQFAEEIFRQSKVTTAVTPILSKDFPTAARRPLWSVLNCEKLKGNFQIPPPNWQTDLTAVLNELTLNS
ncbi:SDR family oxidoreductase [Lacunimicrobium album]